MSKRPGQNQHKPRAALGQFMPDPPLTKPQINALIKSATKMIVPAALKNEWRDWPMWRRVEFIDRLRAKLKSPKDRPKKPFSSNVEPFDYGSPKAWKITNRMNAGCNSKNAKIKMNICSQGVIWNGTLWFWMQKVGYKIKGSQSTPAWLLLHHVIWEQHHGQPVPSGYVISFKDGNPNNLSPKNFYLRTRNDLARCNQAKGLARRSRELTTTLLKATQKPNKSHVKTLSKIRRA